MTSCLLPDSQDAGAAARTLEGVLATTPLVLLNESPERSVFVKAECLQPTGSFKVRAAGNAILGAPRPPTRVCTASAGNAGLAVAWHARRLGIPASVVVPDSAPAAKTDRIARLGGDVLRVPFEQWWQAMLDGQHESFADATFVHPFLGREVLAGNATIGLELARQLPDVDAVVVPFGGGGLALGIACGLRAAGLDVPVYAAEVETACPLADALVAGAPVEPNRQPSFVDGIGGRAVFPDIWAHARTELAGAIVVTLAQVAAALRTTVYETKLVLEGAGATAVAAAATLEGHRRIVAIGSGGNIDVPVLGRLLASADA